MSYSIAERWLSRKAPEVYHKTCAGAAFLVSPLDEILGNPRRMGIRRASLGTSIGGTGHGHIGLETDTRRGDFRGFGGQSGPLALCPAGRHGGWHRAVFPAAVGAAVVRRAVGRRYRHLGRARGPRPAGRAVSADPGRAVRRTRFFRRLPADPFRGRPPVGVGNADHGDRRTDRRIPALCQGLAGRSRPCRRRRPGTAGHAGAGPLAPARHATPT